MNLHSANTVAPPLPRSYRPRAWAAPLRRLIVDCAGAPCRRFTVSHRILRQDGIRLNGAWYCSSHCFRAALSRLPAAAPSEYPRSRTPIHHLLLRQGSVPATVLQTALRVATLEGAPIEDVLLREGSLSPEHLAAARAQAWRLPLCTASAQQLPPSAVLPRPLMQLAHAAPVSLAAGTLLLGFVHEVQQALITAAAAITGYRVHACVIPPAVHAACSQPAAAPATVELQPAAPLRAADAWTQVLASALKEGADETSAFRTQDWIWVRFQGSRLADLFLPLREADASGPVHRQKEPRP